MSPTPGGPHQQVPWPRNRDLERPTTGPSRRRLRAGSDAPRQARSPTGEAWSLPQRASPMFSRNTPVHGRARVAFGTNLAPTGCRSETVVYSARGPCRRPPPMPRDVATMHVIPVELVDTAAARASHPGSRRFLMLCGPRATGFSGGQPDETYLIHAYCQPRVHLQLFREPQVSGGTNSVANTELFRTFGVSRADTPTTPVAIKAAIRVSVAGPLRLPGMARRRHREPWSL